MEKAIITLTKGGFILGLRLQEQMNHTVLYTHPKFYVEGKSIKKIDGSIKNFVGEIFNQYSCLIFIMAAGIVVRAIAPYLRDKKSDPAVIVLDEKGKNVISLLSGHMGGANRYTYEIARLLRANPVITTASDVNQKLAVDALAMDLNCEIENFKDATKVTAHIVNGEKVGLISCIPVRSPLPDNVMLTDFKKINANDYAGLIIITDKKVFDKVQCDTVILRPKNIVIGIGCKRDKTMEEILYAIEDALTSANISKRAIKHMATIDVKKDEKGLIKAAEALGVPIVIVDREQMKKVEEQFDTSAFVKKTVGVGAVCEPAAWLTSKNGKMIQKKKSYDGITIAIVREGE